MQHLYGLPATVNSQLLTLNSNTPAPEYNPSVWQRLVEWLHKQKGYDPKRLTDPEPRAAIEETRRILAKPLNDLAITQDIPEELTATLDQNIFFFSGFKTHHELVVASRMLKGDDGNFKPFQQFLKDVETINKVYNRNYLQAEYNFATASTQMAVKWKEWEQEGDRYDLQYRTAGDSRVREEHAALDGITLPPSDPFWNSYLPPNGWNCRCTAVQVRQGKYPRSDSAAAMAAGANCTDTPKKQIFRFNPGKQEKIFPPKHPYYKVNDEVKKAVQDVEKISNSPLGKDKIKKDTDLTKAIDNLKSGWFEQGFKEIKTEKSKHNNGSTDAKGTIWLRPQIKKNCISGFEKIRTGKECTEDEERSIATLWHEITHNRHDLKKDSVTLGLLSLKETRYMETANEFVARKTLPKLYQKIGGSMKYPRFMSDRDNTGYNNWVVKYQKAIADNNLDEAKVLKTVKKGLFEGDYRQQKQNLINGLVEGGKKVDANGTETYSFSKTDAQKIVDNLF